MKTKPISKHFFRRSPFFILCILVFAYSCNLKSEPPLFVPASKSPLSVGNGPADVKLRDINGDGKLDIITVNYESHDVTILPGDGKGSFNRIKNSPVVDTTAHLVEIGDVNNDSKPDLVISYHHNYGVAVLLGDGGGDFSPAAGSPFLVHNADNPHNHGLALGDVNKDGNLDLVTSNHGHHSVSVMLGDGKGSFKSAKGSPFAVGRGPYPLALADVNKDRNLDIITPNVSSNDVTVLLGDGKAGFTQAPKSPYSVSHRPFFATTGDLNGDGHLDIITSHDDINEITFLLGEGNGNFKPASNSPFDLGMQSWRMVITDINGDGKNDLVTGNSGGDYVTVLVGDGKGDFKHAPGSPFRVESSPNRIAVGDLNGDGKSDIVASHSSRDKVTILLAR